ncbi:MAG: zinc-ribbon domain-containing protein [Candidatus Limnocylindria bacterium]
MARFCANCGTEVEDTAVFCPTCGQPIDQPTDQGSENEIPPAPAWPDPTGDQGQGQEPEPDDASPGDARQARFEEPTRAEEAPPPAAAALSPPPTSTPPPRADHGQPSRTPINLPVTMPLTLSAWLIGGGAALAALGVIIGMFDGFLNPVDLILLLALIGIAASVFFSANVPNIANLRLITLAIVLVGFGIGLDRIGFGGAGIGELILFLGTAAAAIGAILLELGRDQPLGGTQR